MRLHKATIKCSSFIFQDSDVLSSPSSVQEVDPGSSTGPEKEKPAAHDDNIQVRNAEKTSQNVAEDLKTTAAAKDKGQNDNVGDIQCRNMAETTHNVTEDSQVTVAAPATDTNDKDADQERPPKRAAAEKANERISSLKRSAN